MSCGPKYSILKALAKQIHVRYKLHVGSHRIGLAVKWSKMFDLEYRVEFTNAISDPKTTEPAETDF